MNRRFTDPKVIDNDAIVVLSFHAEDAAMTHHGFKTSATRLGFDLTRSDCHNMLHRAMGRVTYDGPPTYNWRLTTQGIEYRRHVIDTIRRILDNVVTAR